MARTSGASTPQNDNAGTHRLETLVATPKETSVAQEVIVAQEQVSEADSEPYDEYSLKVRKGWRTRRPPTDQKYWNPPHDSRFIKENYLQDGLCSPRLKGYHSTYHVYRNRWLPLPQKLASDEPNFMEIPKEFLLPFEAFCLFDKDCSVKPPPPYKLISESMGLKVAFAALSLTSHDRYLCWTKTANGKAYPYLQLYICPRTSIMSGRCML